MKHLSFITVNMNKVLLDKIHVDEQVWVCNTGIW